MRSTRVMAALLTAFLTTAAWGDEPARTPPLPIEAPAPEYPAQLLKRDKEGRVELRLEIDETGVVRDVRVKESKDRQFADSCIEAFRRWRFQPALINGAPVAHVCAVTVEFRSRQVRVGKLREERTFSGTPPKVLKRVSPDYPEDLQITGNRGRVVLRFVVDTKGEVRNPRVVTATHPAFEAPAIEALLKWKFAPGIIDGQPVSANMELPISFDLMNASAVESFVVGRTRKSNLPPALRIDVPAKPRNTVFAVHPYDSAIAGSGGSAEVNLVIAPNGRVTASKVTSASSPEFGFALAAAMEAWTFDPALRDNKPVPSFLKRKYKFEKGGRDSALDLEVEAIALDIRRGRFKPVNANTLDNALKPTFRVAPTYPTALFERGIAGSAKIEVIVDKKGRAVLPRIVEASEPEFGWAAATAAQRWRFDTPKVKGKPVEVKVVIPFKFTPPEPEPEEEEPAN